MMRKPAAANANSHSRRAPALRTRVAMVCESAALMLSMAVIACGGAAAGTAPLQANQTKLHGMLLTGSAVLVRDSVTGARAVAATLTVKNEADTTGRILWGECPSSGPLILFAYSSDHTTPSGMPQMHIDWSAAS